MELPPCPPDPPIITGITPSQTLVEGESIVLECEVMADPHPSFVWLMADPNPSFVWQLVGSGGHPNTQSGNSLLLSNVSASDAGSYTCTASNVHGNDSATVTIQVQGGLIQITTNCTNYRVFPVSCHLLCVSVQCHHCSQSTLPPLCLTSLSPSLSAAMLRDSQHPLCTG